MNYIIAHIQDTRTTLRNELIFIPHHQKKKTKTVNSQKTLQTYKSEVHQQLSIQMAQEAHTVPGVLNSGHPLKHTDSQTHLVAALCLLKPS
jgi:hypothetical protein